MKATQSTSRKPKAAKAKPKPTTKSDELLPGVRLMKLDYYAAARSAWAFCCGKDHHTYTEDGKIMVAYDIGDEEGGGE